MEIAEVMAEYNLPELPEENKDATYPVRLVLFRQYDENIPLRIVEDEDAVEYCERDDTHGDGYFVGWYRV